jgi:uncharacterized protein YeaO (DUF488 family)
MFRTKRIYDDYSPQDGFRIFVDRLWARGMKKESAHIDVWLKEIAPSTELRKWFNHEPSKWKEFNSRYKTELKSNPALLTLIELSHQHAALTLLYGAKEEKYNHARVLLEFLKRK